MTRCADGAQFDFFCAARKSNMAEPRVRVSGTVLSSLMFQHVNGDSDVEGLLLGENRFEEQITISDSQTDHVHIEEIYCIQKHLSCQQLHSFYNSVGDVDMDALKELLTHNKQEKVIGWYRQRRNTDPRMTFREMMIHENLKTSLSNPHMVFILLTPSRLTSSTHRMEYTAFLSRSRQFLRVPVLVSNLGLLEQLGYWKVSTSCSAAGYNLTMKKHGSRFFLSDGLLREVTEVNQMNDSLQAELQRVCRDVEQSERELETLQDDVSVLRTRLRERQQSRTTDAEDPPQQKKNLRLCEAVRSLFCSPLFHTQTLTLQAFPVPDASSLSLTQRRSLKRRRRSSDSRQATAEEST